MNFKTVQIPVLDIRLELVSILKRIPDDRLNISGYILTGHYLSSRTCGLLYGVTRCPPSISVVTQAHSTKKKTTSHFKGETLSLSQVKEHQRYHNQRRYFKQGSVSPPSSGEVVGHLHDETIREAVTTGWRPDGRG